MVHDVICRNFPSVASPRRVGRRAVAVLLAFHISALPVKASEDVRAAALRAGEIARLYFNDGRGHNTGLHLTGISLNVIRHLETLRSCVPAGEAERYAASH